MKRRLSMTITSLVSVCLCTSSLGFTPLLSTQPSRPSALSVRATTDSVASERGATGRLSHEEQQELLTQAVQLRTMKQQITLSLGHSGTPLMLARACGLGDDLFAYQAAVENGERAREELVTSNLGLVYFCVNDICKSRPRLKSLSREDLVQEGCIGLARAIDRWNPEIGGRFSTYAVYWVRAAILRCIAERDDFVRVPEHMSAAIRRVSRAAQSMGIELSTTNPAWKEAQAAKALAMEVGLTERQLKETIIANERRQNGVISYDAWTQNGRDFESDGLVSVSESKSQSQSADDTAHLTKTLARFLRPKEMEALSWRYGLIHQKENKPKARDIVAEVEAGPFPTPQAPMPVRGKQGEAMSFIEVGKKMQVSAEYGRRLVHQALDKLRRAAAEGSLEPALMR